LLAQKARNDFVVLLGDDVRLLDRGWQERIVRRFHDIAEKEGLPFGAACVAMKDLSFPGFPTFPVLHRWHLQHFGSLLPKQFANQGGDPYLYELYSRINAAAFEVSCRLENTIGGDGDARYEKYHINWRGLILAHNLRSLEQKLEMKKTKGICLDIVVPSYRVNNKDFLRRIVLLRATVDVYVKFWIVIDNPRHDHIESVTKMANELNEQQLQVEGNYFINVIHYGANRGASYARNTGFNYTTADWVLFLDDDVIPDENILDAYIGAIKRYPYAKVFVGMTELPESCNLWTEMLCTCNIGYFYAIAKRMVHPSWGVTANLMVRGSRHNSTIQFKDIYPKTGGGEDIDFVYQFKDWYRTIGRRVTVGIPEAKVQHPWWNSNKTCYKQITGWAWGDSLCITEWRNKTFMAFPNWIEHVTFVVFPLMMYTGKICSGMMAGAAVSAVEHIWKGMRYFPEAREVTKGGMLRSALVALGAGSVLSSQEVTRVAALVRRGSIYSLCRRVDWFDGEEPRVKLDIQIGSIFRFSLNAAITWAAFRLPSNGRRDG
jgi:glycosyltransferase involved in cell wall biosynthesis